MKLQLPANFRVSQTRLAGLGASVFVEECLWQRLQNTLDPLGVFLFLLAFVFQFRRVVNEALIPSSPWRSLRTVSYTQLPYPPWHRGFHHSI